MFSFPDVGAPHQATLFPDEVWSSETLQGHPGK